MQPNKKKLFVFDLDDTVMWNSWNYGVALQKLYSFLLNLWERRIPALGSVAAFSEEIDAQLGKEINPDTGKEYGFSMERFPTSFVNTYRHLCDMGFGKYDENIAQKVYEIGMSTFDKKNYEDGLVPGAEEVLDFLKGEGHHLALITKGDKRVQTPKIEALELDKWFRWTKIVDDKSSDVFSKMADLFGRRFWSSAYKYSIGNSFYSDIQPALEAGYTGIYIPCYTWKVEELPEDLDKEKAIVIPQIKDILDLYEQGII